MFARSICFVTCEKADVASGVVSVRGPLRGLQPWRKSVCMQGLLQGRLLVCLQESAAQPEASA